MNKQKLQTFIIILSSLFIIGIGIASASSDTMLMVMKHQCPDNILSPLQSEQDFLNLEAQGNGNPVFALALDVRACPTIRNTLDFPVNGTLAGKNTDFQFTIIDKNNVTHNWSEGKFVQGKICETDLGFDINGDGFIGNNPATNLTKNFCTPASRNATTGCSNQFHLVCGWTNTSDTISYSNQQCACQNPVVSFWTEGICSALTLGSPTCMDISHYEFNITAGIMSINETLPPVNSSFGTLRFTPTQLSANNDKDSLVSFGNGVINLNTSNDTDGNVMLHIYNFAVPQNNTLVNITPTQNGTTIMVMKHLCNVNIKNLDDFENLEKNKTKIEALASTVFNCPTIIEPSNTPTTGVSGGNFAFSFVVSDSNGIVKTMNMTNFSNAKICENNINIDFNNDSVISNSTCLDISSYSFPQVLPGNISVIETNTPVNATFGALRFTPKQLNGNNDEDSFVFLDNVSRIINLNSLNDDDGMIMLHVYNFRASNVSVPVNNTNSTAGNLTLKDCSIRAEKGSLTVEGINQDGLNKINFYIPLRNAVKGTGYLVGQKGKERFSYNFHVVSILSNSVDETRVLVSGSYTRGLFKAKTEDSVISLSKLSGIVSLVGNDVVASNLHITFKKGC